MANAPKTGAAAGVGTASKDNDDQPKKQPLSIEALNSKVQDELTRYPIPPVEEVESVDYLKPMRVAMIVIGIGAALALLVFAVSAEPYRFIEGSGEVALSALGTLFIIALFVERAQQVYVGAWRGIERANLDQRIQRWSRWQEAAAHYPDESDLRLKIANGLEQAQLDLARFRQVTRRYVFFLGLSLGVLIAAAGPRILEQVVEPWGENVLQGWVFAFSDILITGGLIGGGSEAIHKVMTVITDTLDVTRKKVTNASP